MWTLVTNIMQAEMIPQDDVAGNLEDEVADEENARTQPIDRFAELKLLQHLQFGEAHVHAVQMRSSSLAGIAGVTPGVIVFSIYVSCPLAGSSGGLPIRRSGIPNGDATATGTSLERTSRIRPPSCNTRPRRWSIHGKMPGFAQKSSGQDHHGSRTSEPARSPPRRLRGARTGSTEVSLTTMPKLNACKS
ncbi:hypothetical protein G6F68_012289 [Rhizopus microsporus]|nr:hypothetical protein G6F68_012289 [Rhizopus microsporus]